MKNFNAEQAKQIVRLLLKYTETMSHEGRLIQVIPNGYIEEIADEIETIVNKNSVIHDVSHNTTPSYLNDKYKVVQHILDIYQVERNGEPVFIGEKEECHQYVKDELGYCG